MLLRRWQTVMGIGLIAVASVWAVPSLAEMDVQQQRVKAAFVLNMAKFVDWSERGAEAESDFRLCYYRRDVLGQGIAPFRQRQILALPLVVSTVDSLKQAQSCRIVLVGENELPIYILERLQVPTLRSLVIADLTESPVVGMAHAGVHMHLIRSGARIGFEVNLAELSKVGLKVSSELLKLATIVGQKDSR